MAQYCREWWRDLAPRAAGLPRIACSHTGFLQTDLLTADAPRYAPAQEMHGVLCWNCKRTEEVLRIRRERRELALEALITQIRRAAGASGRTNCPETRERMY